MKDRTRKRLKCADDTRSYFIACYCPFCRGKKRWKLEKVKKKEILGL